MSLSLLFWLASGCINSTWYYEAWAKVTQHIYHNNNYYPWIKLGVQHKVMTQESHICKDIVSDQCIILAISFISGNTICTAYTWRHGHQSSCNGEYRVSVSVYSISDGLHLKLSRSLLLFTVQAAEHNHVCAGEDRAKVTVQPMTTPTYCNDWWK